jgi:hypothetical protein
MRKFFCSLFILHLVVICLLSCKSGSKEKVTGSRYNFSMISAITQQAGEEKRVINIESAYQLRVDIQDDGSMLIETTYKDMKIDMDMGEQSVHIDTRQPFNDSTIDDADVSEVIMRLFYAMKGKSITLEVDKEGKIVAVQGLDSLKKQVTAAMQLPESFKEVALGTFDQQFNEANIKGQLQYFFVIVPEDKRKEGGNWVTQSSMYGLTYDRRHTVTSIDKDKIALKLNATYRSDDVNMGVAGEESGTIQLDARTGLVTSSDFISKSEQPGGEIGKIKMETVVKVESHPVK